jgi:hypothetical protein
MKELVKVNTIPGTMSSTQLSKMLRQRKTDIHKDIRRIFQDKIDGGKIPSSKDSRGYVVDYYLPELESKMFVAKKDIKYLEKITQFWIDRNKQENPPTQALPDWVVEANGVEYLLAKFDAPKSMIAAETIKHVHNIGGPDLRDKVGELTSSQDIVDEDVMLEPTELGKIFGVSAIKMNRILGELGLQKRINNCWVATQAGAKVCSRHFWNKKGKSGYNYKWNKQKVTALIEERNKQDKAAW